MFGQYVYRTKVVKRVPMEKFKLRVDFWWGTAARRSLLVPTKRCWRPTSEDVKTVAAIPLSGNKQIYATQKAFPWRKVVTSASGFHDVGITSGWNWDVAYLKEIKEVGACGDWSNTRTTGPVPSGISPWRGVWSVKAEDIALPQQPRNELIWKNKQKMLVNGCTVWNTKHARWQSLVEVTQIQRTAGDWRSRKARMPGGVATSALWNVLTAKVPAWSLKK